MAGPAPWSRLPVELVREVFLLAAADGPKAAAGLCLVARSIRDVVLPILYRSIHLSRAHSVHSLLSALTTAHPTLSPIPPSPTKYLALSFPPDPPSLTRALSALALTGLFTRVTHLALRIDLLSAHFRDKWLENLKPETLMLFSVDKWKWRDRSVDYTLPIFSNVNTLYTCTLNSILSPSPSTVTPQVLPSLTRLALTITATWTDPQISHLCDLLAALPHINPLSVRVIAKSARAAYWAGYLASLRERGGSRVEVVHRHVESAREEWARISRSSYERHGETDAEWYLALQPPSTSPDSTPSGSEPGDRFRGDDFDQDVFGVFRRSESVEALLGLEDRW